MMIPPEDPGRLTGPEVGAIVMYRDKQYPRWNGLLMRVTARSYVWGPGDPSYNGGVRHYDWTVVEWPKLGRSGKVYWKSMVVNDDKLEVAP